MEIKKIKNYHREHRGINVLKKEKITEDSEETKDFVSSVVKNFRVGLCGLCELCVFNRVVGCRINKTKISVFSVVHFSKEVKCFSG